MATTFSVTGFKNPTINAITGASTLPVAIGWMNLHNGNQPVDPSTAVPGTQVYTSNTASIPLTLGLTAAAGGVASLNATKARAADATVTPLTFARVFNTSGTALIDCTVGTGSGGAIISSLSSFIGITHSLTAFSLKMPNTNGGTLLLGTTAINRLVDIWSGLSAVGMSLGTSAQLDIYDGSAPASADLPATGTLLASFLGTSTNWFITAAAGSSNLASNPASVAVGTGTASYFRLYKTVSGVTFTIQGSVGTTGTDLILNTTTLVSAVTTTVVQELTLSI